MEYCSHKLDVITSAFDYAESVVIRNEDGANLCGAGVCSFQMWLKFGKI